MGWANMTPEQADRAIRRLVQKQELNQLARAPADPSQAAVTRAGSRSRAILRFMCARGMATYNIMNNTYFMPLANIDWLLLRVPKGDPLTWTWRSPVDA